MINKWRYLLICATIAIIKLLHSLIRKAILKNMSINDTLIEIIDAWTYFNMALGMAGNLFTLIAIPYAAKRKR